MSPTSLFKQGVMYTQAEHTIIDFISANPTEFLVMPIQQLATRLGVSDATVSRFARHAGFRDFKELKSAVAAGTLGPAEKMAASIGDGPTSPQAFLERQQNYLGVTLQRLNVQAFERAAQAIAEAPSVLLHAKGAAAACAELLRFRLARFGKRVETVPAGGSELFEGLVHAEPESVVVTFGFQRLPEESRIAIEYARSVGATSLLFTGRPQRGSSVQADIELLVYRGEPLEYHSMASAVALVDALVVAVAAQLDGAATQRLESLRGLKRTYESVLPR